MHNSIDTCVFLFYVFNATGLCILTLKLPTSSQRFPHHFFLRSPPRGSRYQWWQESPHPRTWSPSKDGPLIRYIPKAQLRSRQFPFKFFAYHNPFFFEVERVMKQESATVTQTSTFGTRCVSGVCSTAWRIHQRGGPQSRIAQKPGDAVSSHAIGSTWIYNYQKVVTSLP